MRAPPRPRHWCGAECGRHWYSGVPQDRFRRRVRPHHAGVVERNPRVVAERRLRRGVLLVVGQAPFAGDVRRILRTRGLRERQRRREDHERREKNAAGDQCHMVMAHNTAPPRGLEP